VPQTKDNLKKVLLTTEQAAKTASAGSSAQGMVPIRKAADMARPRTGVDPKAKDRWQRENMLRELDQIDADMKARRAKHDAEMKKYEYLRDPKQVAQKNYEETSASRKQFYEADRALEKELAKNEGRKPKLSRAPSVNQVQARATRNSVVEPIVNAASAAATGASSGALASGPMKGIGTLGAVIASQKGAGQSPSVEKAHVDDWNKRTNYGRIQGPTSKAMGVVNVKAGSK
jgi:hypothetical protein